MKRFVGDEGGQALALVALAMTVLMGFAALALDIASLSYEKAKMQKAADAAALAAAMEIPAQSSGESQAEPMVSLQSLGDPITGTALDYAALNGCPEDRYTVQVTPDLAGSKVTVTIEQEVRHFFAGILGQDASTVKVTAAARKFKLWEGAKGQLPFMNVSRDYEVGDDFEFRDKDDENSSVRDWIALNKYDDDMGDLDPEIGIKVAPGNKSGWLSEVDFHGPGVYYIFTLNTELLPFQSKPGISVNGAPIKGELNNLADGSLIDRYARLDASGYYTKGTKEQHSIEQIKLLMVNISSETVPSGNEAFQGDVIGEYSLDHNFYEDEAFIAEWGNTKSRLVR